MYVLHNGGSVGCSVSCSFVVQGRFLHRLAGEDEQ
jgi:hypothetical protein